MYTHAHNHISDNYVQDTLYIEEKVAGLSANFNETESTL